MKLINVVVFTNLWISFAAISCGLSTYILFQQSPNPYILLLLFGGTLSRYNYIVFFLKENSKSEKFRYMFEKRNFLKLLFFLGLVISSISSLFFSWTALLFIAHLGFLSVWYFLALNFGFFKLPKLREIPYIKVFVIAYVWVGSTFLLPILDNIVFDSPFLLAYFERIFFLLGITLPFDIRDIAIDKQTNVKTIATKLGVYKTKILASCFLLVSAFSSFWLYASPFQILISLSYISFIFLILKAKQESSELHFTGLLDGTMIFQLLLVLIGNYFL